MTISHTGSGIGEIGSHSYKTTIILYADKGVMNKRPNVGPEKKTIRMRVDLYDLYPSKESVDKNHHKHAIKMSNIGKIYKF